MTIKMSMSMLGSCMLLPVRTPPFTCTKETHGTGSRHAWVMMIMASTHSVSPTAASHLHVWAMNLSMWWMILQKTHGGGPSEAAGEFNGPIICSVESDGSMLVADLFNHRLQVLNEGEWHVLPLQPQPEDAVVTQQALYVAAWDKLIMSKFQ